MPRRAIFIAGTALAAVLAVAPQPADARDLLSGLIGMVSRPFHGLFGGHRHYRRPAMRAVTAAPTAAAATATVARSHNAKDQDVQASVTPPEAVWPSAYQDVIGYTFWPQDYGPRLQAHGYGDILSVAFLPGDRTGTVRPKVSETTGSAASDDTRTADACAGDPQASSAWPTDKIEQTLQLDDAQKTALDALRTRSAQATKAIQASCTKETGQSAAERLSAMQDRLWTVRDASMMVRASLQVFYDLLSDDQKKQFVVETSPQQQAAAPSQQQQAQAAQMCGAQALREWPAARIEQAVKPDAAQRASLETFRKRSTEMGQLLMASCMKPTPATPLERLDRADERLTTLIFATSSVNLALNDFYGQLSDAQKKEFDSLKR